jgi:hypothetical protein
MHFVLLLLKDSLARRISDVTSSQHVAKLLTPNLVAPQTVGANWPRQKVPRSKTAMWEDPPQIDVASFLSFNKMIVVKIKIIKIFIYTFNILVRCVYKLKQYVFIIISLFLYHNLV